MRSYLLMTIDDDEFYEKQRPLPLADLTVLVSILKEVSMPCLLDTPQNCAENVTGLCYICSFVQYVACCGLPCQCLLLKAVHVRQIHLHSARDRLVLGGDIEIETVSLLPYCSVFSVLYLESTLTNEHETPVLPCRFVESSLQV
jgi:hypothetical protein